VTAKIIETVTAAIPGSKVYAFSPDGTHFQALVISDRFEEMSLVRQHQMVMNALKSDFDSDRLHALQLKTFTPQRWEQDRHQYNLEVSQ